MTLWTAADHEQLDAVGISVDEAARQLALLRNPPPPARVVRPCTLGDGILALAPEELGPAIARAEAAAASGRLGKFIPASGAATRMFQSLLAYLEDGVENQEVESFFAGLPDFAFAPLLWDALDQGDWSGLGLQPTSPEARHRILKTLLAEDGLGLAELPKGLIPFHLYPDNSAAPKTAFEEHLWAAVAQIRDRNGHCSLHFTVSPAHVQKFEATLETLKKAIEQEARSHLKVSFSTQSPATDTLALDPTNEPFRTDDGSLLLRPGGHGALLGNLQSFAEQGAKIALLQNIDNVVPTSWRALVDVWKKALVGVLLDAAERRVDDSRPLRVCGVVRNQGEPGGGPFWVVEGDHESRQIVEASQLDPAQRSELLGRATHFNPVDLICLLKNRQGEPYDLARFVDPTTAFVSNKSLAGRPLRALEHPGLWNGAMAQWETIFVEVPVETFAPVKSVVDLLRPLHRPRDPSR